GERSGGVRPGCDVAARVRPGAMDRSIPRAGSGLIVSCGACPRKVSTSSRDIAREPADRTARSCAPARRCILGPARHEARHSDLTQRRRPLMARTYKVIDADGHILEPLDIWNRYMDPAYRERAPRLILDDNGKERLLLEGKVLGNPKGLGRLGAIGARDGSVRDDVMMYEDGRPGGVDPHARIKDLDLDGIDAAFLYPSIGLFSGAVSDPGLAAAMCRAYNRWLADYCKPYPDRLFGIAMLPMQSIDLAIEEMRFARKPLGMKGGFLRPNPYNGRMANHPDYDPFWAEAQELDFSIGFHEGASGGMPTVGVDRFEGRGARHIISHTMEM